MTKFSSSDFEMEFQYAGFDIYIDSNPDQYSDGFEYSVYDGESLLT